MAKVKVVHDSKAYAELLKSEAFLRDVQARADRVAEAAGAGFEASSRIGATRARASVGTTDFASRRRNSRQNTLIRALEAGRG